MAPTHAIVLSVEISALIIAIPFRSMPARISILPGAATAMQELIRTAWVPMLIAMMLHPQTNTIISAVCAVTK